MLVDSEDMSKVRFICLRRSMPKIAPVFNGAHSNFVVRVFGPNCTSMGGVSYKTESSPITPVKQSLVFLYGMFKPCANFVGITVISAPVSSKKSISFSLCYLSQNSLVIVLDYRGKVATHSPNN